jgi:hypothetical protein
MKNYPNSTTFIAIAATSQEKWFHMGITNFELPLFEELKQ